MVDTTKSFEVSGDGITIDEGSGVWIGGGDAVPTFNAPQGSLYLRTNDEIYKQTGSGHTNAWAVLAGTDNSSCVRMGYNGSAGPGRYLQYQHNIGSDQAPLVIDKARTLSAITIKTNQNETATFEVYKNAALLHTFTITAANKKTETGLTHSLVLGDEISVKVASGSFKDPILTYWFN